MMTETIKNAEPGPASNAHEARPTYASDTRLIGAKFEALHAALQAAEDSNGEPGDDRGVLHIYSGKNLAPRAG